MSNNVHCTFGDLLRQARRAAGLTQEALAEQTGVSTRAISDLERGINRAPQTETLRMLAEVLNLSEEERRHWQNIRRTLSTRDRQVNRRSSLRIEGLNHRVPAPLDAFVGRIQEVADIVALLEQPDVRALTLTGPGGVGKTRLALVIANKLEDRFLNSIWFVNLAPVSDHDIVASTIASTLGIRISGHEPVLSALVGGLRHSRGVLILDNFEQVVPAAWLVAELIAACPHLKIITTSRVPLRIQGEREYPVLPLSFPDEDSSPAMETAGRFDAMQLFEHRARAISASFTIDEHNAEAVAQVCRRLDGLPLAIELAAARTRLLPPKALLKRLSHCLPLLTTSVQGVPERQQTLRNTIAWSYELLEPGQQSLFRGLSVFRGGWSLDALDFMTGETSTGLQDLEALIAINLVRVREQSNGEVRFSMLETINEFAQDQLDKSGEAGQRYLQHTLFFLALAEEAERHFRGIHQEEWMQIIETEHANIRAVLRRSREGAQAGDVDALLQGIRVAGAIWWFWYVRGYHREARELLTPLVHMCREHIAAGSPLVHSPQAAAAYAQSVVALVTFSYWTGDNDLFQSLLQESRTMSQQFDQKRDVASSLLFAGFLAGHLGNFDQALELHALANEGFQQQQDTNGIALTLLGIGETRLRLKEYEAAATSLTESLRLFTAALDARAIAAVKATLGAVRLRQNRLDEARSLLNASIQIRFEIGDKGGLAWSLERMAEMALTGTLPPDSPPMRAVRLLAAAKHLRDTIESPVDTVDRPELERLTSRARTMLSDEAFIAAWEAGRALTLEAVVAYALGQDHRQPHNVTATG